MGKKTLFIVVSMLLVGVAVRTQAQGSNPILEKLDQILAIVTPPSAGPVILSTGFLFARSTDVMACDIANVGPDAIPGLVTLFIKGLNGVTITLFVDSDGIPAGEGFGGAVAGLFTFFRCEAHFEGFASNVRATATLRGLDDSTFAALDAR